MACGTDAGGTSAPVRALYLRSKSGEEATTLGILRPYPILRWHPEQGWHTEHYFDEQVQRIEHRVVEVHLDPATAFANAYQLAIVPPEHDALLSQLGAVGTPTEVYTKKGEPSRMPIEYWLDQSMPPTSILLGMQLIEALERSILGAWASLPGANVMVGHGFDGHFYMALRNSTTKQYFYLLDSVPLGVIEAYMRDWNPMPANWQPVEKGVQYG